MDDGTPSPDGSQAATETFAALMRWYERAGISTFAGETRRDRFAETAAETERRQAGRATAASAPPAALASDPAAPPPLLDRSAPAEPLRAPPRPLSDEALVADARERAQSAGSLEELRALLASFTGCGLRATAKTLVFGNGAEDARLMLVGEAPGREEDLAGEPFVGRSGQFLNRMLGAIGIERDSVRVINTVPWRPPGNRTPTPTETETCLPFTLRHIELVQPRILVCLGSPSTKAILRSDDGIMRLRGRWTMLTTPNGMEIPTLAMLHPAYLLRQPGQKRLAWRDLLALKQRLAELD